MKPVALDPSPRRAALTRHDGKGTIDPASAVGEVIDRRYLLRRRIGAGGMATVYEALHLFTGRRVALKLVRRGDPSLGERLLREASVLGELRHPAIVEVLDAGMDAEGGPFVVLELFEGRTLEGVLAARTKLPAAEVIAIGVDLAGAIGYAHGRGFLHRDIKPGNIFLLPDPRPGEPRSESRIKMIDFGTVAVPEGSGGTKLTGASQMVGTPEYMAPEQLRLEPLDARADLYALGVTLFECLTGTVPHPGSYGEVLRQVMHASGPPSLLAFCPDAPPLLAAAVERAMAHDPGARFPDVASFEAVLRDLSGAHAPPQAATPVEQRRTYARAPYGTPVRLVRAGAEPIDGRSEDISEGGLLVLADRPLPEGERAELRFALPTSGAIARVAGVVRWVRPGRGGKAAVGFEFADAAPEVREAISKYMRWMSPGAPGKKSL